MENNTNLLPLYSQLLEEPKADISFKEVCVFISSLPELENGQEHAELIMALIYHGSGGTGPSLPFYGTSISRGKGANFLIEKLSDEIKHMLINYVYFIILP